MFCTDDSGGFWFWLFMKWVVFSSDLWKGRLPDYVLLCILMAIRGLRYKLYPEPISVESQTNGGIRLREYVKSVINSFWVWFWTTKILFGCMDRIGWLHRPAWIDWVVMVCLTLLVVRILYAVRSLQLVGVLLCALVCILLFWKDTTASIILALFIPGLYAGISGGARLVHYLGQGPSLQP